MSGTERGDSRLLLDWTAGEAASGTTAARARDLSGELERRESERRNPAAAAALRRALAGLPALALDVVREPDRDPEPYRAAGLWMLSIAGTIDDLGLAFDLSSTPGPEPVSESSLEALEAALDTIFRSAPRYIGRARNHLSSIDMAQKARLIRALGRHPADNTFALLGELLHDDERFHVMILAQMGAIANSSRPASEVRSIAFVRDLQRSSDVRVRREAALTLGKIEDMDSFPLLIDLLEDSDERLAANAQWALMRISGRNLRPEARRWEAWYDAEVEWWSTRAQELIGTLNSSRSGDIATALNELTTHRLFRHAIALELRPLLADRRNDIVLLCCAALSSLRSSAALPELVRALEHPDPRIQQGALRALQAITGLQLPGEAARWRSALGLER